MKIGETAQTTPAFVLDVEVVARVSTREADGEKFWSYTLYTNIPELRSVPITKYGAKRLEENLGLKIDYRQKKDRVEIDEPTIE